MRQLKSSHLHEIDLNRNYACQSIGALSTVLHYTKCTLRNLSPAENIELEFKTTFFNLEIESQSQTTFKIGILDHFILLLQPEGRVCQ